MSALPSIEACRLFHEGAIALSQVERNGFRVDVDYVLSKIVENEKAIASLRAKLTGDKVWKVWRRRFGDKSNLYSRYQLGEVLFRELEIPHPLSNSLTSKQTGFRTDEDVLSSLSSIEFIQDYLKMASLEKMTNTFLKGIYNETCNGFLHTVFNLHIPTTYRSSTDSPNLQNMPIRDKEMGEVIRRAFLPRKGRMLIEIDFGGIEVRIAYCYHKDPVMRSYLLDPSKDMHRDMAAECFKLEKDQVTKEIRHLGKNQFVFPQFYGSFYIDCAKALWSSMKKNNIMLPDGSSLEKHLSKCGISKLGSCDTECSPKPGTFEHHIKTIEEDFWKRKFRVYNDWRHKWYDCYQKRGYLVTKTGFLISGPLRRNQVINAPIQGSAFHCLLWSLIRLQEWLNQKRLKTLIVNEVHDSIILDAPLKEASLVIDKAIKIMTVDLPKSWDWIIIPLDVEVETSTTNWYEKSKYSSASCK